MRCSESWARCCSEASGAGTSPVGTAGRNSHSFFLPEVTSADAGQRAEHLREAVKTLRAQHHRQPLGPITVSAGVATYPENGSSGDAVLRAADAAFYQAKAGGRDQVGLNRSGFYPPAATPPWET